MSPASRPRRHQGECQSASRGDPLFGVRNGPRRWRGIVPVRQRDRARCACLTGGADHCRGTAAGLVQAGWRDGLRNSGSRRIWIEGRAPPLHARTARSISFISVCEQVPQGQRTDALSRRTAIVAALGRSRCGHAMVTSSSGSGRRPGSQRAGCRPPGSAIAIRSNASSLHTRGGSRVRQRRPPGSVRGAPGSGCPPKMGPFA